jgi:predicted dinucleotide-binding enzyme
MKIGVIGTGRMGASLGRRWAAAGHQVMFGSRDAGKGAELC